MFKTIIILVNVCCWNKSFPPWTRVDSIINKLNMKNIPSISYFLKGFLFQLIKNVEPYLVFFSHILGWLYFSLNLLMLWTKFCNINSGFHSQISPILMVMYHYFAKAIDLHCKYFNTVLASTTLYCSLFVVQSLILI